MLIFVTLLAALSALGVAATVVTVRRDGYRSVPVDRSRLP
jgi:hypothetical protein